MLGFISKILREIKFKLSWDKTWKVMVTDISHRKTYYFLNESNNTQSDSILKVLIKMLLR